MISQKEGKKCKGLDKKPCIKTEELQLFERFSGRSAVCRACRNKKKREKNQNKNKIDRRQPTPRFITLTGLIMSRLWTDPELKKVSDQLMKNPF